MDLAKVNIPRLEEWLRRLESDEYQQTTHRLHTEVQGVERYCCLGVLCKYATEEMPNKTYVKKQQLWLRDPDADHYEYVYNGYDKVLPPEVQDFIGIYGSAIDAVGNIVLEMDDELLKLTQERDLAYETGLHYKKYLLVTTLNDEGLSFKEIAKILRKYILEPAREAQAA